MTDVDAGVVVNDVLDSSSVLGAFSPLVEGRLLNPSSFSTSLSSDKVLFCEVSEGVGSALVRFAPSVFFGAVVDILLHRSLSSFDMGMCTDDLFCLLEGDGVLEVYVTLVMLVSCSSSSFSLPHCELNHIGLEGRSSEVCPVVGEAPSAAPLSSLFSSFSSSSMISSPRIRSSASMHIQCGVFPVCFARALISLISDRSVCDEGGEGSIGSILAERTRGGGAGAPVAVILFRIEV